jgi:flagella basal body P-ring formation protein FlgA
MKLITLLLVAGGILLPFQARAVVLELRDQQTVAANDLTLNDILKSSQGLTDDDLSAVITSAPSLGNSQTWTRAELEAVLPADVKEQGIQWTGAAQCTVDRPAVQYTAADVKRLITAEIARRLPPDSDFAILELPDVDTFLVPTGPLDAAVELGAGSMRNEWGEATLKFRSQGQLAVTLNVRYHWAYTRKVWQVTTAVNDHDPLTPGSFQQVETNVLRIPGLMEPASDFPQDKIAAHPLPEGKILMENDWVEPMLVKRDDLVTILYQHHGISITVEARAMADGVRNEVIAVQNLSSHKVFNARVVEERSLVYEE